MEFSPVASISIIAPDGSPIYIRKYQQPTTQAAGRSPQSIPQISSNEDLQVESVIFDSLQSIRKYKLISSNKSAPPALQPPIINVPTSSENYSVFACPTSLKYLILILTFKQFPAVDLTIRRCAILVSEQLFQRINDPFYQPFSCLDNSVLFNKIIDESASIVRSQPP